MIAGLDAAGRHPAHDRRRRDVGDDDILRDGGVAGRASPDGGAVIAVGNGTQIRKRTP
jgi:hypothetical protein